MAQASVNKFDIQPRHVINIIPVAGGVNVLTPVVHANGQPFVESGDPLFDVLLVAFLTPVTAVNHAELIFFVNNREIPNCRPFFTGASPNARVPWLIRCKNGQRLTASYRNQSAVLINQLTFIQCYRVPYYTRVWYEQGSFNFDTGTAVLKIGGMVR